MIITYPAKCKDCKFLKDDPKHKRWHICGNPKSPEFEQSRRLKDKVCDEWQLIYT